MFNLKNILSSILVVGLTVAFASFMSGNVVQSKNINENSVAIDTSGSGSSSVAKKKGPQPILDLIATADIARGQKLSKACAACHTFNKGGANKVGPNQWNLVGRDKAATAGFSYSSAMSEKGGKWTYEDLNAFLYKPKAYVKGTKMSYAGLKKTEDRAALIAWMRTMSDSPVALPTADQIAAEKAAQ